MARQTRDERRKRRAESGAAPPAERSRPQVLATVEPETFHAPAPRGGNAFVRFFRFIGESWAELRKVEWPRQQQVIQGTIVVLVACLVVGAYLWGADQVFQRLVQKVLLR